MKRKMVAELFLAFLGFSLVFSASILLVRSFVNSALGIYGVQIAQNFNSTAFNPSYVSSALWEGYQNVEFIAWWGTIFVSAVSSAMTAVIVALVMQAHVKVKDEES